MSSGTQGLLDLFAAVGTVLSGVVRWNGNRYHPKHLTEVLQPISESRPRSIRNRFSQFFVSDHIPHLQVLIGNQVVRLDDAPCQFHGKVFTLPTYFEVRSSQTISRLGSIVRAFFSVRKPAGKSFKGFFRLSQMTGILGCLPIRIGVEVSQPNIQPNGFSRWLSFLYPLNIKTKLNVVPISPANNSHSLNLLQLVEVQVTSSPQLKASRFKAVSEGDGSSIFRQLPPSSFVFNRTVGLMFLEPGTAFNELIACCHWLATKLQSSGDTADLLIVIAPVAASIACL
jgi:hypothetical protein